MKILKRNTRLKDLFCYFTKMQKVAKDIGVDIDIYPTSSQNYIFHVNVDIEIVVHGEEGKINLFDKLIEQ